MIARVLSVVALILIVALGVIIGRIVVGAVEAQDDGASGFGLLVLAVGFLIVVLAVVLYFGGLSELL